MISFLRDLFDIERLISYAAVMKVTFYFCFRRQGKNQKSCVDIVWWMSFKREIMLKQLQKNIVMFIKKL